MAIIAKSKWCKLGLHKWKWLAHSYGTMHDWFRCERCSKEKLKLVKWYYWGY